MNAAANDGSPPLAVRRPDRRVALITGAGSGAGAEIAREYARQGVRVVVSDIDYALAGSVAAEIRGAGGQALAHRCDVASEEQVAALIQRAMREFGALNFVVNNAGPYLADDPLAHWSRLLNTNLLGTLLITRHAIDAMRERGGSIVNIAADAGLGFGPEEQPVYAAAKAGVLRFTAALHYLNDAHGIRVNCIAPDWIGTDEVRARVARLTPDERAAQHVPDTLLQTGDFAHAVVALSLRDSCAGRIVLCRAGRPLELVAWADPGYRSVEPF